MTGRRPRARCAGSPAHPRSLFARRVERLARAVAFGMRVVPWIVGGVVASGCSEPPPVPPAVPTPVAKPEGRVVFVAVLERLAEDPPNVDGARLALAQLREPGGLDAKIARGLAIVIDAHEAQHTTRERLEHEAADLQLRLEATERALAELQTRHDEQAEQLVKIADERARLTKKLGEVESLLSAQEAELEALREELAALKRIDMQRNP